MGLLDYEIKPKSKLEQQNLTPVAPAVSAAPAAVNPNQQFLEAGHRAVENKIKSSSLFRPERYFEGMTDNDYIEEGRKALQKTGISSALVGGVKQTGASLRTAWNVAADDPREAEQVSLSAAQIPKTQAQQAFMQNLQTRKEEAGDDSVMQAIANVAGAAWENPKGAIHEVAAQLPNSGVILGSMFTGAKIGAALSAGNPIVAMAGGIVGLLFGNIAIETGGIAQEQFAKGEYDREDVLEKGAIKGGVITGVDVATMGATRLIFSPFYKAANKASQAAISSALKAKGINPLDDVAVKAAFLSDKAFASSVQKAGIKAASKAMPKGFKSAGLHGTAVGLDMIGEGTGEYGGSVAAGLDASLTDAVMESMMSIPQSAGEVAVGKSLAKIKEMGEPLLGDGDQEQFLPDNIVAQVPSNETNQIKDDIKSGRLAKAIETGDLTSEMMEPVIERVAEQDTKLAEQVRGMFVEKETDLTENENQFEKDPLDAENNADYLNKYIKKASLKVEPTDADVEAVRTETEKSITPISKIPEFKKSEEAIAFGKQATLEQAPKLQKLMDDQDAKAVALKEEGKLQESMDGKVKAQLYNEAFRKSKTEREISGDRAARGGKPPGFKGVVPEWAVEGTEAIEPWEMGKDEFNKISKYHHGTDEKSLLKIEGEGFRADAPLEHRKYSYGQLGPNNIYLSNAGKDKHWLDKDWAKKARAVGYDKSVPVIIKKDANVVEINSEEDADKIAQKAGFKDFEDAEQATWFDAYDIPIEDPSYQDYFKQANDAKQKFIDIGVDGFDIKKDIGTSEPQVVILNPSIIQTHKQSVKQAINEGKIKSHLDYPELTKIKPSQQKTSEKIKDIATKEIPIEQIKLSKDVPQFKEGADAKGVVTPIEGEYERVGTPPVVLWERENGDLELITGRHRFDLAQRQGEETIPAQVLKESEGFTAEQAAIFDAESNIRDEQGSVRDYAAYFRETDTTEEQASGRGLLSRVKGQDGFIIGTNAGNDLYYAYRNGDINGKKVIAIAKAVPNNNELQNVGMKYADQHTADEVGNYLQAVKTIVPKATSGQANLFGENENWQIEADKMAGAATEMSTNLKQERMVLKSVSKLDKAKHKELLDKYGINPGDVQAINNKVRELDTKIQRFNNWAAYPDVVAEIKKQVGATYEKETEKKAGEISEPTGRVTPPKGKMGKPKWPKVVSNARRRYLSHTSHIKNSGDAAAFADYNLSKFPQERLVALLLGEEGKILGAHRFSVGTTAAAPAQVGFIAGQAMNTKGVREIILVHNHPSGNAVLSQGDKNVSEQLSSLLAGTKITAPEIIAVGKGEYVSSIDLKAYPLPKTGKATVRVPMFVRMFKTKGENLPVIASPGQILRIGEELLPQGGLLFLDNKHAVTGVMRVENYDKLRGITAKRILKQAEGANAVTIVAFEPDTTLPKINAANLQKFANAAGMKLLDVIQGGQSLHEQGSMPVTGGAIYFEAGKAKAIPLTSKDISETFAKMENVTTGQDKQGNLWFKFKGFPKHTILEMDSINDRIGLTDERIRTGAFLPEPKQIWFKTGGAGVKADIGSVAHEQWHLFKSFGVVSEGDVRAIKRAIRRSGIKGDVTEEMEASFIGDAAKSRAYARDTRIGRILQKIGDFFDAMVNLMVTTSRGVARKMETGKIAEQKIAGRVGGAVPAMAFEQTAARFYSQVIKTVETKMPAKMQASSVMNWLKKQPGVKAAELEWMNIEEMLEGKKSVGRDELVELLKENQVVVEEVEKDTDTLTTWRIAWDDTGGYQFFHNKAKFEAGGIIFPDEDLAEENGLEIDKPLEWDNLPFATQDEIDEWDIDGAVENSGVVGNTKFSEYQLEGEKENYREFFVTMPSAKNYSWEDGHSEYSDVKNPIVRMRINERVAANGDKILFLEEIQKPLPGQQKGMPLFAQKNAIEIGLKRLIRMAAEQGFDKASWISGQQTADRYDLSKYLSEVHYSGSNLVGYDLDGNEAIKQTGIMPEDLDQHIGKELAERLMAIKPVNRLRSLTDLDSKVGGEWAFNLYDKMIPQFLKKFGKKWGAKTGTVEINTTGWQSKPKYVGATYTIEDVKKALTVARKGVPDIFESPITGERQMFAVNRAQIERGLRSLQKEMEAGTSFSDAIARGSAGVAELFGGKLERIQQSITNQSFTITPQLRQAALSEGMPLFEMAGEKAIGADKGALADAQKMLAEGVDKKKVWRDTGWLKSKEGAWKFEIDDSGVRIKPTSQWLAAARGEFGEDQYPKISNMLDHPELYKAYPELKNTTFNISGVNTVAFYDETNKTLSLGSWAKDNKSPKWKNLKKYLLHEVQHSIQGLEGFARGGSANMFAKKLYAQREAIMDKIGVLNKELTKAVGTPAYDKLMSERNSLSAAYQEIEGEQGVGIREKSFKLYKSLAGEIESRDTSDRAKLTVEQRREQFPYEAQGIPEDQWIIRKGDGTSFSVEAKEDIQFETKEPEPDANYQTKKDDIVPGEDKLFQEVSDMILGNKKNWGKLAKDERKQLTHIEHLLGTTMYNAKRLGGAYERLYGVFRKLGEHKYMKQNELRGNDNEGNSLFEPLTQLKKRNKLEYKRLNNYLVKRDIGGISFKVRKNNDGDFDIINTKGVVVESMFSEDAAWRHAHLLEADQTKFTPEGKEALINYRTMMRNLYKHYAKGMQDIIKMANLAGQPVPKIKTVVDGKVKEISLKVAMARMGNLQGHYFPRIRKSGMWKVFGSKPGLPAEMQFFKTKAFARKYQEKLNRTGYKTEVTQSGQLSEDLFQQLAPLLAQEKVINKVLEQVNANEDFDAVFADMFMKQYEAALKGHGSRARMIGRSDAVGDKVVRGYETDLVEAVAMATEAAAGGHAKQQIAVKGMKALTGADLTWDQFKKDNDKATYKDYQKAKKARSMDAARQPKEYKEAVASLKDILRNNEFADNVIANLKSLTVLKYLGFKISSASINLTNMAMGAPAAISGELGVSLSKAFRHIIGAGKDYFSYRAGKAKNPVFAEIERRGWDVPQFNSEAIEALESKAGSIYRKVVDASMFMFGFTEKINRATTIAAGYKALCDKNNVSLTDGKGNVHEEYFNAAQEASDHAHGVYGKESRLYQARGENIGARTLQMYSVFMTFTHNYLQEMVRLGLVKKQYAAATYMALSGALFGGVGAAVPVVIVKALAQLFGGDDPEEALVQSLGGSDLIRYGLPGLVGVSLRGSLVTRFDVPEKFVDIFGAPGSVVSEIAQGASNISRGFYREGLEQMSPSAFSNISKGLREATEGATTRTGSPVFFGKERLKGDTYDMAMRWMSFNPTGISKKREIQWREYKIRDKYKQRRSDLGKRYKQFFMTKPANRTKKELMNILADMRDFNQEVRNKKIDRFVKPITKRSRTAYLRSLNPRKSERERR